MSYIHLSASINSAEIYSHICLALWLSTRPFTGYEPKQLAENQDHRHFTEDMQSAEHEDVRVKHLFSTNRAQRRPTILLDSDLDDEQFRALVASAL